VKWLLLAELEIAHDRSHDQSRHTAPRLRSKTVARDIVRLSECETPTFYAQVGSDSQYHCSTAVAAASATSP
jgi:hypothetical protein